MVNSVTDKDQTALQQIRAFIRKNQFPPTSRELMRLLGFKSPRSATKVLVRLKEQKAIKWNKGSPRSIVVLKTSVWE